MERIIDISVKDGTLWAEDTGYISDFTQEDGYLFSVAISYDHQNPGCRMFNKDFKKAVSPFKGKYYITITYDYDGELHITDNFNHHLEHNIDNDDGDNFASNDYQETLTLDMDDMKASSRKEDIHEVAREITKQAFWDGIHKNSYRQPY